jgi:hypothetical protein
MVIVVIDAGPRRKTRSGTAEWRPLAARYPSEAMHSGSGRLQEEPTYASVFGEAHRPARGCLILLFSESLAMEIRRFCVDEHHSGGEW